MSGFIKSIGKVDSDELTAEVHSLPEHAWLNHSPVLGGIQSLMLVSVAGLDCLDLPIMGPMKATPHLAMCPRIRGLIQSIRVPVSRVRLMRLPGKSAAGELPVRESYYWFRRSLNLIPLKANRDVRVCLEDGHGNSLEVGGMVAVRDAHSLRVRNDGSAEFICIVIEFGKRYFDQATQYADDSGSATPEARSGCSSIDVEDYLFEVLSFAEVIDLTEEIISQCSDIVPYDVECVRIKQNITEFRSEWRRIFSQFGHSSKGELAYRDLLVYFRCNVAGKIESYLKNRGIRSNSINVVCSMLETSHLGDEQGVLSRSVIQRRMASRARLNESVVRKCPEFDRPVFIVSAPRAGSTLLFETMLKHKEVWSVAEESHEIIEQLPELRPAVRNFESNRLTARDVSPAVVRVLRERFTSRLQDFAGRMYVHLSDSDAAYSIRFLEKTPKNALRIPFLKAIFPTALFIYLVREAEGNIASLVEGWRSGQFVSYRRLPQWPYENWSFLLPPGWQAMSESSVAEIAAYQWEQANLHIIGDLECLPLQTWRVVNYSDLIENPRVVIRKLCEFVGIGLGSNVVGELSNRLPLSSRTLSLPGQDKCRKVAHEFESIKDRLSTVQRKIVAAQELQRSALGSDE